MEFDFNSNGDVIEVEMTVTDCGSENIRASVPEKVVKVAINSLDSTASGVYEKTILTEQEIIELFSSPIDTNCIINEWFLTDNAV